MSQSFRAGLPAKATSSQSKPLCLIPTGEKGDTLEENWKNKLMLTSEPHTCEEAGKYRVLVKVIDIFGKDTSKIFKVEVK